MLEQILEEVLLLHFVFVSFFNYHIICVAIGGQGGQQAYVGCLFVWYAGGETSGGHISDVEPPLGSLFLLHFCLFVFMLQLQPLSVLQLGCRWANKLTLGVYFFGMQEEKLVELDLAKMIFMKKNSMEMDLAKDVIQTMILAKDLKAEMEMAKKVLEKDLKAETEMAKKVLKKNLRKDLKAETEMAKKVLTKNLVQEERAKKMLEKVEILEVILEYLCWNGQNHHVIFLLFFFIFFCNHH